MSLLTLLVLFAAWGVEGKDERDQLTCGDYFHGFDLGDCVTVLDGCGKFVANTTHLTVIGSNFDGQCLVARVSNATHESCKADQLVNDSTGTCGDEESVAKEDEFNLLLGIGMLLHVGLAGLVCYAGVNSSVIHGLLFWWSDFWAGLYMNMVAALALTSAIDDPVRSFIVSLVVGLILVEVFYGLPLQVFKNYAGPLCWICAVWILGCFYFLLGITAAYQAAVVALMGHHAILHGLAQWIADILKAVVKKQVLDCVCQRPQKQSYLVLVTELAVPLPEVPSTEEGKSQEDPGKV